MVVSLYHNQNKFIMLYFLTEDENGIIEPKIYEPERDISYKWQQTLGKKLHGIFGRLDYATWWCNFYNGLITRDELNIKLESVRN